MMDLDNHFLRNMSETNSIITDNMEELTMEPLYGKPLKLVFHDINSTVLYIGDGCPIMIYIGEGTSGRTNRYYLTIKDMHSITAIMEYENVDDRAADYAYAINAIDKFMRIKEG